MDLSAVDKEQVRNPYCALSLSLFALICSPLMREETYIVGKKLMLACILLSD